MERRRAVAVSNVRRSKSLLFDYMHIGALIEEPKTQISRRRSISSLVRENKDYINDFDDFSNSSLEVSPIQSIQSSAKSPFNSSADLRREKLREGVRGYL